MAVKRKLHSAAFKAKVALEAYKADKTSAELISAHKITSGQISTWKKQLLDGAVSLFETGQAKAIDKAALTAPLYEEIGRLKVELDWLKKKRDNPLAVRQSWLERDHEQLSLRDQCELLGLNRASVYYQPKPVSSDDRVLMSRIDKIYTRCPFYGSRRITAQLNRDFEHGWNRKHIQRLMRIMGIRGVAPGPDTRRPHPEHKIYPYLLRGVFIDRINQVWSTDITYIPMAKGFMYLTAVMDWYSRYVLSWTLSNTLDTSFCTDALEQSLAISTPEIFNTDQGTQYTSQTFTQILLDKGIRISMDGRGRALDNIFVERLWRTVKYENIYMNDYQSVPELRFGLNHYFQFYNQQRLHQSLDYQTPAEVYFS